MKKFLTDCSLVVALVAASLGMLYGLCEPAFAAGATGSGSPAGSFGSGTAQPMHERVANGNGAQEAQIAVLFFTVTPSAIGDSGWLDTRGFSSLSFQLLKNAGGSTVVIDTTCTVTGATAPAGTGTVQWQDLGTTADVFVTVSPIGAWTRVRQTLNAGGAYQYSSTAICGGVFRK